MWLQWNKNVSYAWLTVALGWCDVGEQIKKLSRMNYDRLILNTSVFAHIAMAIEAWIKYWLWELQLARYCLH